MRERVCVCVRERERERVCESEGLVSAESEKFFNTSYG